jgi:hypothetical protein
LGTDHIIAATFFCGLGEAAEPALQGLASSFVEADKHAQLFTSFNFVKLVARILANPLIALLLKAGRERGGKNGVIFLVSSVSMELPSDCRLSN